MMMFVIGNPDIKLPRRLSAKNKVSNFHSIRKLRALWNEFDNETRMRATKTIRCLETQEFFK